MEENSSSVDITIFNKELEKYKPPCLAADLNYSTNAWKNKQTNKQKDSSGVPALPAHLYHHHHLAEKLQTPELIFIP